MKRVLGIIFFGIMLCGYAQAENAKDDVFLTGRDWKKSLSDREKFMALLPPAVLFQEYDVRLRRSLPEYIVLVDLILRYNPQLEEEDVANIFTSTVYRYEPESRVALKTMELQFLQGDLEIKPLHGPRLTYEESRELFLPEFSE